MSAGHKAPSDEGSGRPHGGDAAARASDVAGAAEAAEAGPTEAGPTEGRPTGAAGDEDDEPEGDEAAGAPETRVEPTVPEGGTLLGACEAILLVASEPLELRDVCELLGDCHWVPVRRALRELQRRFAADDSGLEVVEVAKGWRLVTKGAYRDLVERALTIERRERLTRAQLEVISVVAYRQPVTRADIDAIRGADSSGALRGVMDKGLVRVVGRADRLGRPLLYGTTRGFLERFGLKNLEKLPRPGPLG